MNIERNIKYDKMLEKKNYKWEFFGWIHLSPKRKWSLKSIHSCSERSPYPDMSALFDRETDGLNGVEEYENDCSRHSA